MAITIHVGTDGGWDPVPLSFYNNGGSVPEHAEGDTRGVVLTLFNTMPSCFWRR